MTAVFLKIVNMSITANWLILAVVPVRQLLKKAPKWIPCLLWGLVAIRLICPFSFESILSLIPSSETIPANITLQHEPAINSGITAVNELINPVIAESFTPSPGDSANPLQVIIPAAAIVWIAGIVIMLVYAFISCIKLKKTVSVCVPVSEGILSCDEVRVPFILGVFRPVIYVPSMMTGETLDLVIRHETAHLQRYDHWWKPLGFLLLAVYWFNPLCWIAYILLCRDIEMACDEKVIRDMNKNDIAAYSQALLDCSFPRRRIAACPLAFGEVGVKERVKGVLNYKKPAFWMIVVAVAACIVMAICFLTSPTAAKDSMTYVNQDSAIGQRADFNVDIGKNVRRAELTVEMWQNGQCTSSGPVLVTSHTEKITLHFSDRRENLNLIGENIQIDIDETAGALVSYFSFPEHVVGWLFTSWQDTVNLPVHAGEDVILAAMTFDMGNGVWSFDCQSLSSEPERLTSAECMIVVRAAFYETDVPDTMEGDGQKVCRLTLEDVRTLSQKGEALSWNDFAGYEGREIGSGLYIMQYVIDDVFDVLVGGPSPEEEPWYIYLRNRDINAWVDIRTDDIEEFINDHSSNAGGVYDPGIVTVNIRADVCELYLLVLEDLWNVDSGLNHGISLIGIDLSGLSHLTESEKETVMQEFASKHDLPYIAGTWEELCEQGYIDKDNLYWEDGLFFSIKTNEDAVWNLPAIKVGDPIPELTAFDAQKWRSGLGAYFFGQCTAQKNADGKWSYTVGMEAIS